MPKPKASPLASIVIVAYGKRAVTEACLASLERVLGDKLGRELELVLVDNASPDDTLELFDRWQDRARVLRLPVNRNFSGGCNAGAAAATGRALIFLNHDTIVLPDVLERLAEQALQPGVGAAGIRLLFPDGTIQHAGLGYRQAPYGQLESFHFFVWESGDVPAAGATFDLDAVTGACLALPRDLFHELGGFDEAYVNGCEDVDLCLRVRLAGHRIVYRGDLAIFHDEGTTRRGRHDANHNLGVFFDRWRPLLDDDADALERIFDAQFHPRGFGAQHPAPFHGGSLVSVEGPIAALAPEGDEARALLALLDAGGLAPAARAWQPEAIAPRLPESEWALVLESQERPKDPTALTIHLPVGTALSAPMPHSTAARLAALPRQLAAEVVWAASPGLVRELVQHGFPAERVSWMPPVVADADLGAGGDGVLALLPAHDLAAAAGVLDALEPFGDAVRVLPSVASPPLEQLVSERLPGAELLRPLSAETSYRALVSGFDVVVCGDASDRFERRALVAASVGVAPVTLREGPAAAVLGPHCLVASPDTLRKAVERAFEAAGERAARSDAVRAECGPVASEERLQPLLDRAVELRSVPVSTSV